MYSLTFVIGKTKPLKGVSSALTLSAPRSEL